MIGSHKIRVQNNKTKYEFEIRRNITIVRGDSGTGKTTLYDMIAEYTRLKASSGIQISSDKACVALIDMDWMHQLNGIHDSIVFIDEGAEFLTSRDFAVAVSQSDNYYVIFNRENLYELPFSVNEIYEIQTSGKFHSLQPIYLSNEKHIYSDPYNSDHATYDTLLTEDSESGFQFFNKHFENDNIKVCSGKSKSGIYNFLQSNTDKKTFIVADGAAFGAEMDKVMKVIHQYPDKFTLCLPESFEWLILKSGLINNANIIKILSHPEEYIDSKQFLSWERYFTKLLIDYTSGTHMEYTKKRINTFYTIPENSTKIIDEISNGNIK